MSLHKLNQAELNQDCKKYIESVEIWLRRLIDQTLTIHYGSNYLTFQHANGDYLIKNEIRNAPILAYIFSLFTNDPVQ